MEILWRWINIMQSLFKEIRTSVRCHGRSTIVGRWAMKTLVSDYQILSSVRTFGCTIAQQSSLYISGDNSRPFVRRFLPYSSFDNERRLIWYFLLVAVIQTLSPPQLAITD